MDVLELVLPTTFKSSGYLGKRNVVLTCWQPSFVFEEWEVDSHEPRLGLETIFVCYLDLAMEKTPQNLALIKKFTAYVVESLKIQRNAEIVFLFGHDPNYPSAGGYLPQAGKVIVAAKNRAVADIMRTLAHELTHHRQFELGMIGPEDTDNQMLEDQANVYAGRLVRWFGRENKEIYADLA